MDIRQRPDDSYRRKLQRIRVKSIHSPLKLVISGKNNKLMKLYSLKIFLILIVLVALYSFLRSPTVCHLSNNVSRWIWGETDPRYVSDLNVNWEQISSVLTKLPPQIREVGILNFNDSEIRRIRDLIPSANHTVLRLDYAEKHLTWESLYPEWIDEEQEKEVPKCPSLPKVEAPRHRLDLVIIKLPCKNAKNWSRDVARLHLQLSGAHLASSSKGNYAVNLLFVTQCFPIPNLFRCKDLIAREGTAWLYRPNPNSLREKLQLPVGSCELSLPLEVTHGDYTGRRRQREAYVTILHSAHDYVCGAIAAARSIRAAGSTRDLVILVDETITGYHRSGLELAGWKVRTIERIRNPKAERNAYNEWNYSKFRLWQLTDYDRVVFIDADLIVLRNIDFLFGMDEISATGNNGTLFNSGVMVVEPSECTFRLLMDHVDEIESYNGGDQGYLNEIFTWWHRIPKHMNFLKNFWVGDDEEAKAKKVRLFEAEPSILYVLHYLGNKPWMCYRDYDCNWNVDILQEFASDVANDKWWRVHDAMPEELQGFCLLMSKQKAQLEWDRRQAEKGNYSDGHWRIRIGDKRMKKCIDPYCNWKSMLRHWGESNWTDAEFPVPLPPALKGRA